MMSRDGTLLMIGQLVSDRADGDGVMDGCGWEDGKTGGEEDNSVGQGRKG